MSTWQSRQLTRRERMVRRRRGWYRLRVYAGAFLAVGVLAFFLGALLAR
jgi:hypothetical protein